MRKIEIGEGRFALVDDCDYAYLSQWNWYVNNGYAFRTTSTGKCIYMHRVILERMGYTNFVFGDHIDRDRADNRRQNLRPATSRQSNCNQSKRRNNTTGYIGVTKDRDKWRARIRTPGGRIHLGCFDDKKDAALAYNKAARNYHGEFAVLNKVT